MSLEDINAIAQAVASQLAIYHKELLTIAEVALLTGFSEKYIYNLSSKHQIPCHNPTGKHLIFARSEIENWLLCGRKVTDHEIKEKARALFLFHPN